MHTTLKNRKKATLESPRSALKRKNKAKEGGALGSGIKREQDSAEARAQKVMRGRVAPSIVPTLVQVVPTMVKEAR